MQHRLLALAGLMSLSLSAHAVEDLDALQNLGQAQFRLLSEDLGAALSYKSVSPAEPLGITGFDIAFVISDTKLENQGAFQTATASTDDFNDFPMPKVQIHKGLPLNFDIGASYTSVNNIDLVGAELKYALLEGGIGVPAIAIRGTYSKVSGVEQLDFETKGAELTISKGLANVTPYAGIGRVWVTSTPKGDAAAPPANLTEEDFTLDKYFVGLNLNFGVANLGVEGDQTGDATTYSVKIGLRF